VDRLDEVQIKARYNLARGLLRIGEEVTIVTEAKSQIPV